jgi:hypothetical protein
MIQRAPPLLEQLVQRFGCGWVLGKPSRMIPFCVSGSSSRRPNISPIRSSGKSFPAFMISSAILPISEPALTAERSMSPVDSWIMPRSCSSRLA